MIFNIHRLNGLLRGKFRILHDIIDRSISSTNLPPITTLPMPKVPPHRKRSVRISYDIYDQAFSYGRRKDAKFVFTASCDLSDDKSKIKHSDDYCRSCQTTYYKRHAIPNPDVTTVVRSIDTKVKRLQYLEARGEVKRVCSKCRLYIQTLIHDVKGIIGKEVTIS